MDTIQIKDEFNVAFNKSFYGVYHNNDLNAIFFYSNNKNRLIAMEQANKYADKKRQKPKSKLVNSIKIKI